jgi:hypothetical protein
MQPGEEPPSLHHHHHQISVTTNAQTQLETETTNNSVTVLYTKHAFGPFIAQSKCINISFNLKKHHYNFLKALVPSTYHCPLIKSMYSQTPLQHHTLPTTNTGDTRLA